VDDSAFPPDLPTPSSRGLELIGGRHVATELDQQACIFTAMKKILKG
jgi:hypothetical protein